MCNLYCREEGDGGGNSTTNLLAWSERCVRFAAGGLLWFALRDIAENLTHAFVFDLLLLFDKHGVVVL